MRWLAIFAILDVMLLGAAFAALWAYGGPDGVGLSGHGMVALVLGITGTAAVAVGLMGLVFESARTDHDRHAHGTHQPVDPTRARPQSDKT